MGSMIALVDAPKIRQEEPLLRHGVTPPAHALTADGKSWYQRNYESLTSEWCDNVYSSSSKLISQEPEIGEIAKYIKYLVGDQWVQDRPSYRAKPVINKLLNWFYGQLAILSDVRMNTIVETQNPELRKLSENLTKMSYANWASQDGDLALMFTEMHASVSGIGYTKVGYNPVEDEVSFLPLGPDSVIPILPCQTDFQQSGGAIYQAWKPISWGKVRYPYRWHLIKPEAGPWTHKFPTRPYYIQEYTWNNLNPGMRDFLADDSTGAKSSLEWGTVPMFMLNEFWYHDPQVNESKQTLTVGWGNYAYYVKPGDPIFPFGRLTVTAGQTGRIILYDGPNCHWHGMFPFVPLRLRPAPWLFGGISDIRDLYPINNIINQSVADFQDYSKQLLNPVVISRDRQISPDSWDDYFPGMPGAKIRVLGQGQLSDIIKFERPSDGSLSHLIPFIEMMIRFFDTQSGMVDVGRMASKKQVPGADTIEQIRDSQQGTYRLKGRFIEQWQKGIGRLQIPDIVQYTTKKKVIATLGPDGETWTYLDWDPESIVPYQKGTDPFRRGRSFTQQFKHQVAAGSALPSQRRDHAMIMSTLAAQHKISLKTLYASLRATGIPIGEYDKEIALIKQEMEELPQPAPRARGGQQRPPRAA